MKCGTNNMTLYTCIAHIYKKESVPILKAYEENSFEFSHVQLLKTLSLDPDSLQSLAVLGDSYLYLDPRDAVLVSFLLVPFKARIPFLKNPEKSACKIPSEWYHKLCRVMNWSKKEANYNEDIIHWHYTNNKDYFNEV
jgi:hypothetical protein